MPGRPQSADEKTALADNARELSELEKKLGYSKPLAPDTAERKAARVAREAKRQEKEKAKAAAKGPNPSDIYEAVTKAAVNVTNKAEPNIPTRPANQFTVLGKKDKTKAAKVEHIIATEKELENNDRSVAISNVSFDQALKNHTESPGINYHNQNIDSKHELIEQYEKWLKILKEKQKNQPQNQTDLEEAKERVKKAQEKIQNPRQYLATLAAASGNDKQQKALYEALELADKLERRIAALDYKQQLAAADTKDQIAQWTEKWDAAKQNKAPKEYVTYGQELKSNTLHGELANDILNSAILKNQTLKEELHELGKNLKTVQQNINEQKAAQASGWFEKESPSLIALKKAEERIKSQFKRIEIEIKTSEEILKDLFKKANKPLNKEYQSYIKDIVGYENWSETKKLVVRGSAASGGMGVITMVASVSGITSSGAIAAAIGMGAMAFPPAALLLVPAAAALLYYKAPLWVVNMGDSWDAWRGNPFSSEADKDEFLIARVAGTSALTRTVSKEKDEHGEHTLLHICIHITKWSSMEDVDRQVMQFLGECMWGGLVETDIDTGEKTLHITNIPKDRYIDTRAALVILAGRFDIKLTGPAFEKVADIQNAEEHEKALAAADVRLGRGKDKKYEDEHPNAPGVSNPETLRNLANAELLSEMLAGNNPMGKDDARRDLLLANQAAQEQERTSALAQETTATGGIMGVGARPITPSGTKSIKLPPPVSTYTNERTMKNR